MVVHKRIEETFEDLTNTRGVLETIIGLTIVVTFPLWILFGLVYMIAKIFNF